MDGLIDAIRRNQVDTIRSITQTSTDLRKALVYASMLGRLNIVKLLIEKGVDVNYKFQMNEEPIWNDLFWSGDTGFTALILASKYNHPRIIQLLVKNGADVNLGTTAKGRTALIEASVRGKTDIVEILLKAGADVDRIASRSGLAYHLKNANENALISASRKGYTEIVRMLLEAGADINIVDNDGKTALMHAKENGHAGIVRLLDKASLQYTIFSTRAIESIRQQNKKRILSKEKFEEQQLRQQFLEKLRNSDPLWIFRLPSSTRMKNSGLLDEAKKRYKEYTPDEITHSRTRQILNEFIRKKNTNMILSHALYPTKFRYDPHYELMQLLDMKAVSRKTPKQSSQQQKQYKDPFAEGGGAKR